MVVYGRRKKHIYIGISLCLCLILNCSVVGITENIDVKTLDDAMERIGSADSLTIWIKVALMQNGVKKLAGEVICQADKEKEYLYATLVDETGKSRVMEIASSDGERIIRDGDDYYAIPEDRENEVAESIIIPEIMTVDRLRKDLKKLIGSAIDKLTITDSGLSLQLTRYDIPFFLGVAVGFADGYEIRGEETDGFALSLGYGLYIDHIDLDIPIEDGDIGDIRMEIALGGRSKDSSDFTMIITMDCSFLDIDSTIPNTIDTTGVELKSLE